MRQKTSTSNFGVGARESHDSKAFYERFRAPIVSTDDEVGPPIEIENPCRVGDSRDMADLPDSSVALVVTSPPYFAGKQYEEELERDGVPATYLEFLDMLRDVFACCVRKLEPGGRIAVNVANLGRKPYRSLSCDVINILSDDLGLLLRGELIWRKGEGATGSCAWGSFRSPANPVLRDVSERIIVASKGRFDRALSAKQRAERNLPHVAEISSDDFLASTLDVWSMPTESATRVGHPAPFPVELPEQLIRLYTYKNDLVLDPFMGSGSTLIAAAQLGRRYVGYDLDPNYAEIAKQRLEAAQPNTLRTTAPELGKVSKDMRSAIPGAKAELEAAGFTITAINKPIPRTGISVSFAARDKTGGDWLFDVAGSNTAHRGGLTKVDTVWRAVAKGAVVANQPDPSEGKAPRFVVLSSALPKHGSQGDRMLRSIGPNAFFDILCTADPATATTLSHYASGTADTPTPGFWGERELSQSHANNKHA